MLAVSPLLALQLALSFGFSHGCTVSMVIHFLFGLAWIPIGATNILFATIGQIVIPNQYLGRINSVTRSMGTIAMPLGSLIGGYTANVYSSQLIFALASIGILFISSYGYFIRNYGLCRKQMKLQRILLSFSLRKNG